jgi:hypothetical protein
MLCDDDFASQRRFTETEMKALVNDNWPAVYRVAKHVERYGKLTVHLLQSGIAHELCLMHRDMPVLRDVLMACSDDGVVSIQKLREVVVGAKNPLSISPRRPPYAIRNDEQVESPRDLDRRRELFRRAIQSAAGAPVISRRSFGAVVSAVDRFGISDREASDLFSTLDPKRSGFVNVEEFIDRFTLEFLKPKSMRPTLGATGADGRSNAFEWPIADRPATARRADGSPQKPKRPQSVKSTRSSLLRRETADATKPTRVTEELPRLPQPPARHSRMNLTVVASPRLLGNLP